MRFRLTGCAASLKCVASLGAAYEEGKMRTNLVGSTRSATRGLNFPCEFFSILTAVSQPSSTGLCDANDSKLASPFGVWEFGVAPAENAGKMRYGQPGSGNWRRVR